MSSYDYTFKICIFAGRNVGKKSLSKRFSKFEDYSFGESQGVHFFLKTIGIYGKIVKLHYWLLLGNTEKFKRFHPDININRQYIVGSNGIILMYDISNRDSFKYISEWYQLIKDKITYDVPILLVGNKLDLEKQREISKEEVEKLKKKYGISSSMEISLKTGENVLDMSTQIANLILEPRFLKENRENFMWIIDRKIKTKTEKFEGKRKLKKQEKLWRKHHIGETDSFEAYLDKQKQSILTLTEYREEIMNTQELSKLLELWKSVEKLLNSDT